MIGTLKIKSKDQIDKDYTENLGDIDATNLYSADSSTRLAFAQQIDTFTRAVTNLTTNTYNDAIVEIKESINDIIAEGVDPNG